MTADSKPSSCPLSHAEMNLQEDTALQTALVVSCAAWQLGREVPRHGLFFPNFPHRLSWGNFCTFFTCETLVVLTSELVWEYSSVGGGQVWSPMKIPCQLPELMDTDQTGLNTVACP